MTATKIPAIAHRKLLAEYHHAVSRTSGDWAARATAIKAAVREPVSRHSQNPSSTRTSAHDNTDAAEKPRGASRISCPISFPRHPRDELEKGRDMFGKWQKQVFTKRETCTRSTIRVTSSPRIVGCKSRRIKGTIDDQHEKQGGSRTSAKPGSRSALRAGVFRSLSDRSSLVHLCPQRLCQADRRPEAERSRLSSRKRRECKETLSALKAFLIPIGRFVRNTDPAHRTNRNHSPARRGSDQRMIASRSNRRACSDRCEGRKTAE